MIGRTNLYFSLFSLALAFGFTWLIAMSNGVAPAARDSIGLTSSKASFFEAFQDEDGTQEETSSVHQEDEPPGFPPAEELIQDWEKPEFALFVSGRLHGYIEPCGCVGLDRQKGGLLRRHSLKQILTDRGWDVVMIDTGNQIRRFGQQGLIKLRTAFLCLCRDMNYDAIGLGPDDVTKASSGDLSQLILDSMGNENPFICANVTVLDSIINAPYRIVETNGRKIGIAAILGDEHLEAIKDPDIQVNTVAEGLNQVIPQLQAENCDLLVLTAHSSPESCIEIARQFPVFDLLVTSGGAGDPKMLPERIEANGHTTQMIYTGKKGMHVGVVGFYGDRSNLKYERVPLDARFTDSEQIKERFLAYQAELKDLYIRGLLRDVRPRPHPSGHTFVGSDACAECHEAEYEIWKKQAGGPHTQATIDLEQNPNNDRMWVQRNYDPECLSCHVTGWNPQEYYPYESGFLSFETDQHLMTSGCENCHGPGSEHIRVQNEVKAGTIGERDEIVRKTNKEVRLTKSQAKREHCMTCHDIDNSPDYVLGENAFAEYWAKIAHGGGKVFDPDAEQEEAAHGE